MRLLYLYPEEWTGRRAREVHTLATCLALAEEGIALTLLVAGGIEKLEQQLGSKERGSLRVATISRTFLGIRSARIFEAYFRPWLARSRPRFDFAFTIHLKGAVMLKRAHLPYAYEAHEIFSETESSYWQMEADALSSAKWRIATSAALAVALSNTYALPNDFLIAPNAGRPPLHAPVAGRDGPFVYAGSIADWKGLNLIVAAAREAQLLLRIVGGTAEEWQRFCADHEAAGIEWCPRVPLDALPAALAGARAGLIATDSESPSGHFSCPMKLFDYARCGLPVITTALPSLQSLNVRSWCTPVEHPTVSAWRAALENFRWDPARAAEALAWAGDHTWAQRGRLLAQAFTRA